MGEPAFIYLRVARRGERETRDGRLTNAETESPWHPIHGLAASIAARVNEVPNSSLFNDNSITQKHLNQRHDVNRGASVRKAT